ncbi:MAG: CoA-binding protein [Tissierellia bacterium]|nr:CoA-binding protein [Tissierellia bacterium]
MYDKYKMLENKNWAVIGVTDDRSRYGYKIPVAMRKHGYNVYGINPKYDSIDGEKIYSSLSELPETVDAIDMVVAPKFGKDYLREAHKLGIKNVFFQPGTYDEEIFELAKELNFNIVMDCVYATLEE